MRSFRSTVLSLVLAACTLFYFWESKESTKIPRGSWFFPSDWTEASAKEDNTTNPTHSPNVKELLDEIVGQSPVCAKKGPPLNVLALGGSVTWGAALSNRSVAYPFLMASNATNLAIRAAGPEIPSVCLQSMLEHVGLENVEYDLITVEYSLNGIACIVPLLRRLRRRYPNAMLMYVDVWSFLKVVVEKTTKNRPQWLSNKREFPPVDVGEDALEFLWPKYNVTVHSKRFVEGVGGVFYRMPLPENPKTALDEKWFESDARHMDKRGHEIVAEGIMRKYCETLENEQEEGEEEAETLGGIADANYPYDGTWGLGDHCTIWFMGDEPSPDRLQVEGATLVEFDNTKFAYEVPTPREDEENQGLTFRFQSPYDKPYKLGFLHMEKLDWYPQTIVTIKGKDPQEESTVAVDPREDGGYHISRLRVAGQLLPQQENTVTFKATETTSEHFRIVGMTVCPECTHLYEKDHRCHMFESRKQAALDNLKGDS